MSPTWLGLQAGTIVHGLFEPQYSSFWNFHQTDDTIVYETRRDDK
jgi:hypothetical protein